MTYYKSMKTPLELRNTNNYETQLIQLIKQTRLNTKHN